MTLAALRDDAITSTDDGFALRLGLPWIRSLPVRSLDDLDVVVDGERVEQLVVVLGDRLVDPSDLARESGWWFIQDRVVLRGRRMLPPGVHHVAVSFRLVIPYLQAGPDGPLILPFHVERSMLLGAAASAPAVSRDVA